MAAPYLEVADLLQQPLGVAWTAFGGGPTTSSPPDTDNASALLVGCEWASAEVNREANQNLGCALVSQDYYVPSHRASVQPNGTVRLLADLFPVLNIALALSSVSAQPWPKNWVVIPPGAAWPERRPVGVYGTSEPSGFAAGGNGILIGGGFGGLGYWSGGLGRGGVQVFINYLHGWPHSVLVEDCTQGATSLAIDEVAGMQGAALNILDGTSAETVQVASITMPTPPAYSASGVYFPGVVVSDGAGNSWQCGVSNGPGTLSGVQALPTTLPTVGPYWSSAVVPAGPGTINLVAPTTYAHTAPVLVTAIPKGIRWATALYAKAWSLQNGLAAVSIPGSDGHAVTTEEAIEEAMKLAAIAVAPYCRIY